ncbi:MAG: GTPase HflX [Rhodospirillales bacterium]
MSRRKQQRKRQKPDAAAPARLGGAFTLDRKEFAPRLNTEGGARRAAVIHPRLPSRPPSRSNPGPSNPQNEAGEGGAAAGRSADARLAEARGLAEAINLDVAYAAVTPVPRIRPATLLGVGAVEALKAALEDAESAPGAGRVEVVIIDGHLTPVQQRNLETALERKVIDRTGLILEIFGARARTREGRLQVELAALTYQRSRLVRSWTHLERQRGGLGFVGGPGETQIETDRRLISGRIARLKKDIAGVRKTRTLHRAARKRVPYPVVALVGYTNAGKSTLFNVLTGADARTEDQVFATLDPALRGVKLPSGRPAIVSDTVGFISDLPHELVEAFRATLEEVEEADLVIHVRDAAHPDAGAQRADVIAVLNELITDQDNAAPRLDVFNKTDAVTPENLSVLQNKAAREAPGAVFLSALTGDGVDDLRRAIDAALDAGAETYDLTIPFDDGEGLAWIYRHATVLSRENGPGGVSLSARMTAPARARLEHDLNGRRQITGRPA